MTLEERLQQMIGQQAFAICALQTEMEKVQAELAKLKAAEEKARHQTAEEKPPAPPRPKVVE